MNSYGNNYGCHTPFDTERVYGRLKRAGFDLEDLSWHNDEGDSIKVNDKCTVWIPNGRTYVHYGYVPYLTVFVDEDGSVYADEYDWGNEKNFESEDELIEFLIKNEELCTT